MAQELQLSLDALQHRLDHAKLFGSNFQCASSAQQFLIDCQSLADSR